MGEVPKGLEPGPGERERGEAECWRVCCRWPAAWTAAVVTPWLAEEEDWAAAVALVDMERGFDGPVEGAAVEAEGTWEEACVAVGVFDKAVVEVPLWMAEWARKAARKLARKDRLVGMFVGVVGKSAFECSMSTPALGIRRERDLCRVCTLLLFPFNSVTVERRSQI